MRLRKQPKIEETGAPLWMITFSDMMTLLLAFFILLFSFSVIEEAKFGEVAGSLRQAFLGAEGVLEGAIVPADIELDEEAQRAIDEMQIVFEQIQLLILEKDMADIMNVRMEERGIVLEITDRILFTSSKAYLRPESLEALSYVADILARIDNRIIVEGHTDNLPINTFLFPSNWELSAGRAIAVVRYLVEAKGLEPTRFKAVGFGEFYPTNTNLTVEGRQKNRRVNIIISTAVNEL